jgi:hypothetical protein
MGIALSYEWGGRERNHIPDPQTRSLAAAAADNLNSQVLDDEIQKQSNDSGDEFYEPLGLTVGGMALIDLNCHGRFKKLNPSETQEEDLMKKVTRATLVDFVTTETQISGSKA